MLCFLLTKYRILGDHMEKWPNFLIVGAPRAGTTSLYEFLKRTPGIYMSPMKEPHYFSSFSPNKMYGNPVRDKKKYLSLFKNVKDEVAIGEASTTYLWDKNACNSIFNTIPNVRIVIMLRDPVQRAFSHYLMRVGGGYYSKQVKQYLEKFGGNLVKIIIFEEFIKNPKKSVKELLDFLQVNADSPKGIETVHNEFTVPRGKIITLLLQNKIVRKIGEQIPASYYEPFVKNVLGKKISKPMISDEDKEFLEELYRDDVKKLEMILGRELPWNI